MQREAEARVFGRSRARHPGNLTAYVIFVSFLSTPPFSPPWELECIE